MKVLHPLVTTLELPFINRRQVAINQFILPSESRGVQISMTNELNVKKALLALVTTPNLRAAHLFTFKELETEWLVYEPECYPLNKKEVRGALVFAIQALRRNLLSNLESVCFQSEHFLSSVSHVSRRIEKIKKTDKVFIILVFQDYILATGNQFDETTLCHAMLSYRSRIATKFFFRKDVDYERLLKENQELFQPRSVHVKQIEKCYKKGGKRSKNKER